MKNISLSEFKISNHEMTTHRSKLGYNPYRKFNIPKTIEIDGIIFEFFGAELKPVWGVEFIYKSSDFICPVRFTSKS